MRSRPSPDWRQRIQKGPSAVVAEGPLVGDQAMVVASSGMSSQATR